MAATTQILLSEALHNSSQSKRCIFEMNIYNFVESWSLKKHTDLRSV